MIQRLAGQLLRARSHSSELGVVARCMLSSDATNSGQPYSGPEDKTHFGYQEVDTAEKSTLVGGVFSSVAPSYDVMNDLMSAGVHRLWKDKFVSMLQPFAGMEHLDVAGGTGDIAFRVLRKIREAEADNPAAEKGSVLVADINAAMLAEGKKRAASHGYGDDVRLRWLEADAEKMPCASESFDAYTIAFGIRNVTDIPAALREAHRVLKTGGRFLCLEFSQVTLPVLKDLYDVYSFNVIPQIGRLVANDAESYQYLVESIRRFPPQDEFADMILEAGFSDVKYDNLSAGIVAIHSGTKW